MMNRTYLFLFTLLLCSQTFAYILPNHPTKTYLCDSCDTLSHERLKTNWDIAQIPFQNDAVSPYKSYSYNLHVTAKQLQQGIALATTAPGAVVLITPLQNKSIPELELKTPANQSMTVKNSSSTYSADEALSEALMETEHQVMMQIKPELGFGSFTLKSKHITTDSDNYLINVFDKFSSIYLQLEPHALRYQYGDQFTATISLHGIDASFNRATMRAALINTNEQRIPLKLTQINHNQFEASASLLAEENPKGGNWYIEAEVLGGLGDDYIKRSARTAFSYSLPSARLVEIKKTSKKSLAFSIFIEVATASRYGVQSVLFHTKETGEIVPLETSQSAQWLEPGIQVIKFSFDNFQQLAEDTLSVGYLHVTDYGQLKTVYQYNQPIKLSQLMD